MARPQLALLSATLICLSSAAHAQATTPKTVTKGGAATTTDSALAPIVCSLDECYQRAMERSPLIAAARLDLETYVARLREARAASWPTLSYSGFASILPTKRDDAVGNNPWTDYDWTRLGPLTVNEVSFALPLFTFGKLATLRRLADQGIAVGKAVERIAAAEMRFEVSRAWWTLQLMAELSEVSEEARGWLSKKREGLIEKRDDGADDYEPNDLLKLRMLEADFEGKVREAERTRALAEDGLRAAMDEKMGGKVVPLTARLQALEFPLRSTEDYVDLALANHPKLIAARAGRLATLRQLELARRQLLPDIALVGRIAHTYAPTRVTAGQGLAADPYSPTQSGGGLAIRWNLDIFRRLAQIDQADLRLRRAVELEKAERVKAIVQARRLVREVRDAREMIAIHETAMKAARGLLAGERQMHEQGFQEFKEVLKATEQYYRRWMAWLQAIYNYNVGVAQLSKAIGLDVDRLDQGAAAAGRDGGQDAGAAQEAP